MIGHLKGRFPEKKYFSLHSSGFRRCDIARTRNCEFFQAADYL
ncbi:Uncharacterized protein dnm_024210 [Desulfonema magnum]|uniref:Uncharacterized protein n=1 Tax=Desulfonema magnum TaxID=45655 RepID=A0A975GM33_9BACT|nr:Uncharacterized protein dnm_024210 [Desulfonema magnum]